MTHAAPPAAEPAPPADPVDPAPAPDAPRPRAARRAGGRASTRFRREEPRELRHRLSIAVAVAVSRVVAALPGPLRRWSADRVGYLWWRLAPTYRANVAANLARAMGPEASPATVGTATRRIFRLSAHNFADLLRLPHTGREELVRSVRLVEGDWAVFDRALAQGRGVVLMTAHLGAFEFVGHALTARGYPLTSVTGRTTSRFLFDAVTHLRGSRGMRLVEATPGGVRRVIQALRRGEVAAFLADYDFFQNGRPVVFFGRETTLPPGPIRIARDTGALVVGSFARRTEDGYALSLAEPFEVEKTADLEADIERGMARALAVLERAIGATPDQWVMFQQVWPSAPADPVRVFPVGSPLESELLRRVDAVLPEPRLGGTRAAPADPPPPPPAAPTGRTDPPPRSPAS